MNKYLQVGHFCKKRMGINRPLLRDLIRQVETKQNLMNDNDILNEAFIIQSIVYHNALFNTISKKFIKQNPYFVSIEIEKNVS